MSRGPHHSGSDAAATKPKDKKDGRLFWNHPIISVTRASLRSGGGLENDPFGQSTVGSGVQCSGRPSKLSNQ